MEFSDWLLRRLTELNKTQQDVADAISASKASVSNWASGKMRPSRNYIEPLAKALDVNPEYLLELLGNPNSPLYKIQSDSRIGTTVQKVNKTSLPKTMFTQLPLLNSTQAVSPAKSIAADDVEGFVGVPADMKSLKYGKNAFCFEIEDDSMVSADRQTFRRGTIVIIDPDAPLEPGMFVLAKVQVKGVDTAVFRAYLERETIDGFDTFELAPISKAVSPIKVTRPEHGEVIGVYVGAFLSGAGERYC